MPPSGSGGWIPSKRSDDLVFHRDDVPDNAVGVARIEDVNVQVALVELEGHRAGRERKRVHEQRDLAAVDGPQRHLEYGRTDLADIARDQMVRLTHISNLFITEPALELAVKMLDSSNKLSGREIKAVQFLSSGSEANETALKYARLYALRKKGPGAHKLLSFRGAFHGSYDGVMAFGGATGAMLPDGRRLHLHHGPIDLICEGFGPGAGAALERAARRFDGLLTALAMSIALLAALTLLPQLIIIFKPFGSEKKVSQS